MMMLKICPSLLVPNLILYDFTKLYINICIDNVFNKEVNTATIYDKVVKSHH